MRYFWSKSKAGVYVDEIHGDAMPADCAEITPAMYQQMMDLQAGGNQIQTDDKGLPVAVPIALLPLSTDQVRARFTARVQREIDALAASWGYDSVISAATYAASSIDQFKREAQAILAYRDAMWQWAGQQGQPEAMTSGEYASRVEILLQSAPAKPDRPGE